MPSSDTEDSVVGIDVGGTKLLGVVVDTAEPEVPRTIARRPTPSGTGALIDALASLVDQPAACEMADALNRAQQQAMWQLVARHVEVALEGAEPAMRPPTDEDEAEAAPGAEEEARVFNALKVLHGATILLKHTIADLDREAAPESLQVAEMLHDIIFDLQDARASELQAAIVEMCEAWWLGERAGD